MPRFGLTIFVAHSSDFDFRAKLYEPLRSSELNISHKILLPQEGSIEEITREMIQDSDLLLAEVSRPSLGVGIEIGWADAAGVPVIALSEVGAKVSWSIDNAITHRFEYKDPDDMLIKLMAVLWEHFP